MADLPRTHALASPQITRTIPRMAITQSELFLRWPAEDLEPLVAAADVIQLDAGEVLHGPGEEAHSLFLLATGSMRVSTSSSTGREFTTRVYFAGDFHGLGPLMSGDKYIYTVTARTQTHLVRIPGKLLIDMLSRNGRLAIAMFAGMNERHRRTVNQYADASTGSVRARVAGLLESFLDRAPRQPATEVHLSQAEVALLLGTRRQVVNRELRALETLGLLRLEYGHITVLDRAALHALVESALSSPDSAV